MWVSLQLTGWITWIALTLVASWSGYIVGAAFFRDRLAPERLAVALTVTVAMIVGVLQALGLFGLIRAAIVAPSSLAVFLAVGLWARRRLSAGELRSLAIRDLGTPVRVLREAWVAREPLALAVPWGVLVLATSALLVWIYKTWNYDAVVYHSAITSYVIQDGGTALQQTHSPWVKGYPINVSLLAVWNCLFPRDNRLDDSPQLVFALIAALVVGAWSRRLGASRPAAMGLGALFLLLPPIAVQLPTGQVDIACAAMFTLALYFAAFSPERRDRWVFLIAFGLYVGTKFTGLFHLLLFAPVVAARVFVELRRAPLSRRWLALDVALSLAVFLLLGGPKYVHNLVYQGNPLWPFTMRVPLVGLTLPGLFDSSIVYGYSGGRAEFFGMPGDLERLWKSWMHTEPVLWPDVRQGGFGPLFRWLLLPAVGLLLLGMFRRQNWRRGWAVLLLFALTLAVPAAWWPRYTMALAAAGLVALAIAHADIRWTWARVALSFGALALTLHGAWKTAYILVRDRNFYMWPTHFSAALAQDGSERATLRAVDWLWPTEWAHRREKELGPGEVITYDESADFLAEYFSRDFHTRVEYLSSAGPPDLFLKRVLEARAKWVGVRAGSAAERALQSSGAERLFQAPRSATAIYRMPEVTEMGLAR